MNVIRSRTFPTAPQHDFLPMASSQQSQQPTEEAGSAWPKPPRYYLEPRRAPPAPPTDAFNMFGVTRPPLGGLPPLPPLENQVHTATNDAQAISEVRRLNKVLLASFVELLAIMQSAPTQCVAKVGEIRNLMLNMQHLLNSLRAFQAREELIALVQAQVDAKQRLIDEIRESCEECRNADALHDGDGAMQIDDVGADATHVQANTESSQSYPAMPPDVAAAHEALSALIASDSSAARR